MHITTNTMTREFSYDSVSMTLTIRLHSVTYITHMPSRYSHLNPFIQGFLSGSQKPLDFWGNFAYAKRITAITIKPIQQSTTINRDDITLT